MGHCENVMPQLVRLKVYLMCLGHNMGGRLKNRESLFLPLLKHGVCIKKCAFFEKEKNQTLTNVLFPHLVPMTTFSLILVLVELDAP